MNRDIELRAVISEPQSERLRKRLKSAGIDGAYREEQHGAILVAHIKCYPSHEKAVRQTLPDLSAQTPGD